VDAEAIKKAPDLAAWRGRKYVLERNELEAFLRSLEEVYDVVVRLLDDASELGSRDGTHDPSVASGPGENAHRLPSRMCGAVASASTLDARALRALATLDPVRDICGILGVESRFNKPIDFTSALTWRFPLVVPTGFEPDLPERPACRAAPAPDGTHDGVQERGSSAVARRSMGTSR
jgi:hypothetical protein